MQASDSEARHDANDVAPCKIGASVTEAGLADKQAVEQGFQGDARPVELKTAKLRDNSEPWRFSGCSWRPNWPANILVTDDDKRNLS
jgi:hypothetical protein